MARITTHTFDEGVTMAKVLGYGMAKRVADASSDQLRRVVSESRRAARRTGPFAARYIAPSIVHVKESEGVEFVAFGSTATGSGGGIADFGRWSRGSDRLGRAFMFGGDSAQTPPRIVGGHFGYPQFEALALDLAWADKASAEALREIG